MRTAMKRRRRWKRTAMKAAKPGDHLEYPWALDPHTTPRRWETRRDQDGQTYSYAQFFWHYWQFDTFTRKDLDDYWETLPLTNTADQRSLEVDVGAAACGVLPDCHGETSTECGCTADPPSDEQAQMLDATAPLRCDCEGRGIRESERTDRRVAHQVPE